MITIDLIVLIKTMLILGIIGFAYLQYKVSKLRDEMDAMIKFSKGVTEAVNEVIDAVNELYEEDVEEGNQ
jgi:hypothetical protein